MDFLATAAESLLKNKETTANQVRKRKFPAIYEKTNPLVNSNNKKAATLSTSKLLRRWCMFEHFYSTLDYGFFSYNEFTFCLTVLGYQDVEKISKSGWKRIRREMEDQIGKVRRLSKSFLTNEREKLSCYREEARVMQLTRHLTSDSSFPFSITEPIKVGDKVIVYSVKSKEFFQGFVLSITRPAVDTDTCQYLIQFDENNTVGAINHHMPPKMFTDIYLSQIRKTIIETPRPSLFPQIFPLKGSTPVTTITSGYNGLSPRTLSNFYDTTTTTAAAATTSMSTNHMTINYPELSLHSNLKSVFSQSNSFSDLLNLSPNTNQSHLSVNDLFQTAILTQSTPDPHIMNNFPETGSNATATLNGMNQLSTVSTSTTSMMNTTTSHDTHDTHTDILSHHTNNSSNNQIAAATMTLSQSTIDSLGNGMSPHTFLPVTTTKLHDSTSSLLTPIPSLLSQVVPPPPSQSALLSSFSSTSSSFSTSSSHPLLNSQDSAGSSNTTHVTTGSSVSDYRQLSSSTNYTTAASLLPTKKIYSTMNQSISHISRNYTKDECLKLWEYSRIQAKHYMNKYLLDYKQQIVRHHPQDKDDRKDKNDMNDRNNIEEKENGKEDSVHAHMTIDAIDKIHANSIYMNRIVDMITILYYLNSGVVLEQYISKKNDIVDKIMSIVTMKIKDNIKATAVNVHNNTTTTTTAMSESSHDHISIFHIVYDTVLLCTEGKKDTINTLSTSGGRTMNTSTKLNGYIHHPHPSPSLTTNSQNHSNNHVTTPQTSAVQIEDLSETHTMNSSEDDTSADEGNDDTVLLSSADGILTN